MCHSIKVHKVVYCHPYVCCYIHPSSLWIRYFITITPGEMLTGIRALTGYLP
jgi:hypothetical protein